jgi:hypothetical protein
VNVYEVKGDIWLAGFVDGIAASIYHDIHPMLGWVYKDDFVQLIKPVHPGCKYFDFPHASLHAY